MQYAVLEEDVATAFSVHDNFCSELLIVPAAAVARLSCNWFRKHKSRIPTHIYGGGSQRSNSHAVYILGVTRSVNIELLAIVPVWPTVVHHQGRRQKKILGGSNFFSTFLGGFKIPSYVIQINIYGLTNFFQNFGGFEPVNPPPKYGPVHHACIMNMQMRSAIMVLTKIILTDTQSVAIIWN
jgi:hypothetical protein